MPKVALRTCDVERSRIRLSNTSAQICTYRRSPRYCKPLLTSSRCSEALVLTVRTRRLASRSSISGTRLWMRRGDAWKSKDAVAAYLFEAITAHGGTLAVRLVLRVDCAYLSESVHYSKV